MIETVIDMLNIFPSKIGISSKMSSMAIVEGAHKFDLGVKRIQFGANAMMYIGTKNDMKARSVPAIALNP